MRELFQFAFRAFTRDLELKKEGQQLNNMTSTATSSEAIARVSTRTISSPEDASTNANGLSESYEPEPDKGESHPGKVSHDQENDYLFQRLRSMSRLHEILRSLQFYFRNCIDLCIQENIIAVLFSLPAPEECRLATHTVSRLQQMCLTHVYHKTMAAVLLTLEDAIHL